MDSLADLPQTKKGLNGLRDRYVRRAEYLCWDATFHEATRRVRERWNESFQSLPVYAGATVAENAFPSALYQDWRLSVAKRPNIRDQIARILQRDGDLDGVVEDLVRLVEACRVNPVHPIQHWVWAIHTVIDASFPSIDFPNPYLPELSPDGSPTLVAYHPAFWFVGIALQCDPRLLLGECERLFAPMSFEPVAIRLQRNGDEGPAWYRDEVTWFLPLYPGITPDDIIKAAPAIAQKMRDETDDRTTTARVVSLRKSGLSFKKIGQQLGLAEKTASRVYKNAGD